MLVAAQDFVVVLGVENELAGQQDVHDHTQTEDVDLAAISKVVQDFRGHVARRSTASKLWPILACCRETEIYDDQTAQ